MTTKATDTPPTTGAEEVGWDIGTLVDGDGADGARRLLVRAMEAEGWENYPLEWWHFSLPVEHSPLDVPLVCYSQVSHARS